MKSHIVASLAICFGMTGCTEETADSSSARSTPVTSADVKRDVAKAADTVKDYAEQGRQIYQDKIERKVENLDEEIAALKSKGKELTADARQEFSEKMETLKEKRQAADEKLAEIKNSSGDAWMQLQSGFESAFEELRKAFNKASAEINTNSNGASESESPQTQ